MLESSPAFNEREVEVCLEIADEVLGDVKQDDYVFDCSVDENDQPNGIVVYGEASLADRVWELYWIAVDPECQGGGLGRKLLEYAEEKMGTAGGRMCLIETSGRPDYDATNRFYQRAGYRETARVSDFYRQGDDLVIYRKDFGIR
jgi:ribosomal protein S18 acetylase RimI-like enzyme